MYTHIYIYIYIYMYNIWRVLAPLEARRGRGQPAAVVEVRRPGGFRVQGL